MTSEPLWFHRVICCDICGSWLICASIWRGPYTVTCRGYRYSLSAVAPPLSAVPAIQAVMFWRFRCPPGVNGTVSANTVSLSPGNRCVTKNGCISVSYTHLRAHETDSYLVCRLLLEKKKH